MSVAARVEDMAKDAAEESVDSAARARHIVEVGRRGDHRAHQPRSGIHAHMGLHPDVPLVSLLGLVHFGVAPRGADVVLPGANWTG